MVIIQIVWVYVLSSWGKLLVMAGKLSRRVYFCPTRLGCLGRDLFDVKSVNLIRVVHFCMTKS